MMDPVDERKEEMRRAALFPLRVDFHDERIAFVMRSRGEPMLVQFPIVFVISLN